jgi:drug/metabolite transporter (DMT)-like permease
MTLFLIALGFGSLLCAVLLWYGGQGYGDRQVIAGITGVSLALACVIGLVFYGIMIFRWVGAKHQADIINREYGTHYTQAEVFYAFNVIYAVRELDCKRVGVNGDLLRGVSK